MTLRIALALGLLLVAATPAAAREVIPLQGSVGSPEFLGDEVIYGNRAPDGTVEIRAAGPTGANRLIRSFPPFPGGPTLGDHLRLGIATDGRWLAVQYSRIALPITLERTASSSDIGPVNGPWRRMACEWPNYVSVDRGRVAYSCSDQYAYNTWIVVEDIATGAEIARIDSPAGASYFKLVGISGDYVAYDTWQRVPDGRQIVVWSLATRSEVYRAVIPQAPNDTNWANATALRSDGTVVNASDMDRCNGLAWFSPSEPVPHTIPGCRDGGPGFAMSGNLVATRGVTEDKQIGLRLSTLDGRVVRFIGGGISAWDLDGERVAYVCGDEAGNARLVVEQLGEEGTGCPYVPVVQTPVLPPPYNGGPPGPRAWPIPEIRNQRARVNRRREVRVRVACQQGCHGDIVLTRGDRAISTRRKLRLKVGSQPVTVILRLRRGLKIRRPGLLVQARLPYFDETQKIVETLELPFRVLPPRR